MAKSGVPSLIQLRSSLDEQSNLLFLTRGHGVERNTKIKGNRRGHSKMAESNLVDH
jgi:hypothetical protein